MDEVAGEASKWKKQNYFLFRGIICIVDKKKASTPKTEESSILLDAAKAIGRTAGKVAAIVGAAAPADAKVKAKNGRIPKSNKSRLPRKEKKAAQTASHRAAAKESAKTAVKKAAPAVKPKATKAKK